MRPCAVSLALMGALFASADAGVHSGGAIPGAARYGRDRLDRRLRVHAEMDAGPALVSRRWAAARSFRSVDFHGDPRTARASIGTCARAGGASGDRSRGETGGELRPCYFAGPMPKSGTGTLNQTTWLSKGVHDGVGGFLRLNVPHSTS
jgi:hypothetical protein